MSQKSAKQNRKVQELEALLKQSEQENAELREEVKRLHQKMDRLTEQFLNAQRARFGQSSEKKAYVMGDGGRFSSSTRQKPFKTRRPKSRRSRRSRSLPISGRRNALMRNSPRVSRKKRFFWN